MNDHDLMQSIRDQWGAAIDAAVRGGPVPPALVAAIIANESAGDSKARRFEKAVFTELALVVTGKKSMFSPAGARQPMGRTDVLTYIFRARDAVNDPSGLLQTEPPWVNFTTNLDRLITLATSHGLTQVMGWHWIEFEKNYLSPDWTPQQQLDFTTLLLTWFANHYALDPTRDFEQLLRSWNTGLPDGQTFDPNYVPHGIARLTVYRQMETKT